MVDIHHHLLAGLDDGARNEETSVLMARMAADDGISHIVCTPHANDQYRYDRSVSESRRQALQERLAKEGIPVTLGLGCDFHLSYQNVQEALDEPSRFTINKKQYLLLELPDYGLPATIGETFLQLQTAGLRLILTHPERNLTLAAEPGRMLEWLRHGMLLQVTADSVTGKMGRAAYKAAHHLLRLRLVHFLASDGHNTSSRPPQMKAAYDIVARQYGPDYAEALCWSNPYAVFYGRPLDPSVEADADALVRPKGWLRKLFRA